MKKKTDNKKENTKKTLAKRKLTGVVVSTSMKNTVVVKVTTKKIHPLYKKVIKTWKKYMADSNGVECSVDDSVVIQESRKLSANKKWIVLSNLKK